MERLNTVIQAIIERKAKQQSPLCAYVYDLDNLRVHTASLSASLPPSVRLFYAVKANADERILKTVAPYVTGFEVASGGELQKVRRLFADSPVIFGGPGKQMRSWPRRLRNVLLSFMSKAYGNCSG